MLEIDVIHIAYWHEFMTPYKNIKNKSSFIHANDIRVYTSCFAIRNTGMIHSTLRSHIHIPKENNRFKCNLVISNLFLSQHIPISVFRVVGISEEIKKIFFWK